MNWLISRSSLDLALGSSLVTIYLYVDLDLKVNSEFCSIITLIMFNWRSLKLIKIVSRWKVFNNKLFHMVTFRFHCFLLALQVEWVTTQLDHARGVEGAEGRFFNWSPEGTLLALRADEESCWPGWCVTVRRFIQPIISGLVPQGLLVNVEGEDFFSVHQVESADFGLWCH